MFLVTVTVRPAVKVIRYHLSSGAVIWREFFEQETPPTNYQS